MKCGPVQALGGNISKNATPSCGHLAAPTAALPPPQQTACGTSNQHSPGNVTACTAAGALRCVSPSPLPPSRLSSSPDLGAGFHSGAGQVGTPTGTKIVASTNKNAPLSSSRCGREGKVDDVARAAHAELLATGRTSVEMSSEPRGATLAVTNHVVIGLQQRSSSSTPTDLHQTSTLHRPQIIGSHRSASLSSEQPVLVLPELRTSPVPLDAGMPSGGPSWPPPPLSLGLAPLSISDMTKGGVMVMPLSLVSPGSQAPRFTQPLPEAPARVTSSPQPQQQQQETAHAAVSSQPALAGDAVPVEKKQQSPTAPTASRLPRNNSSSSCLTERISAYNAKKKLEDDRAKEEERKRWEKKDPLAAKRRDFERRRNELYAWNAYLRDAARQRWGDATASSKSTSSDPANLSNKSVHGLLDSGQGTKEGTQQILHDIMDGV